MLSGASSANAPAPPSSPPKGPGSAVPVPCQDKGAGPVSKHHHVAALLYFFPLGGSSSCFLTFFRSHSVFLGCPKLGRISSCGCVCFATCLCTAVPSAFFKSYLIALSPCLDSLVPFWEWKGAGSPWGHMAAGAADLRGDTFGVPILADQTLPS